MIDFAAIRPTTQPASSSGSPTSFAEIDLHADGEEEDAEQQRLERLDGRLDRLAVFGFGEQQAGDESAERHRQAGLIGDHAGADDDEQHGGDEQVARARGRDQTKQRPHQHAAENDDHRERDRGGNQARWRGSRAPNAPEPAARMETNTRIGMTARSCASSTEKLVRPTLGGQPLLLGEEFEHDRGRGQRQAGAENDRHRRLLAGRRRDAGDQSGGEQNLQSAQSEDQPVHRQEAAERQFEADQEQQKDDAEFGNAGDVIGVADGEPIEEGKRADERAEAERPEDGAGHQIAERRAQAEAADDRHQDAGRAEHDQRVAVGGDIDRRVHERFRRLRASTCRAASSRMMTFVLLKNAYQPIKADFSAV